MRKLKDLVHTEKYEVNGEERKKYTNVGSLLERDDGSQVIKFLGVWINLYDPRPKSNNTEILDSSTDAKNATVQSQNDLQDEVPF